MHTLADVSMPWRTSLVISAHPDTGGASPEVWSSARLYAAYAGRSKMRKQNCQAADDLLVNSALCRSSLLAQQQQLPIGVTLAPTLPSVDTSFGLWVTLDTLTQKGCAGSLWCLNCLVLRESKSALARSIQESD